MASRSDLNHLFVGGITESLPSTRTGGGDPKTRPIEDRLGHGQALRAEYVAATRSFTDARALLGNNELMALGAVVTIEAASPDHPLQLDSLERWSRHRSPADRQPWWLLLAVNTDEDNAERAAVWIADGQIDRFLKLFDEYIAENTPPSNKHPEGRPKHEDLIANMAAIRRGVARDLWTSPGEPPSSATWHELVVRGRDDAVAFLRRVAGVLDLQIAEETLEFGDRTIVWCRASWSSIEQLVLSRVDLTEIRRPSRVSSVLDLETGEQDDYVAELRSRLVNPSTDSSVSVCILDTGILSAHQLIEPFIGPGDVHTVVASSGGGDVAGHGTLVGGLAVYADLRGHFDAANPVDIGHSLESVKILPDRGANDEQFYARLTAAAVSLPELARGLRRRVFNLAVTAQGEPLVGRPTTWSTALDALANGSAIDQSEPGKLSLLGEPDNEAARIFVVSAGNVREAPRREYLDTARTSNIEEPAQAWNVLTVGAYTDLCTSPPDPAFEGWTTLASPGELSPHSRTGVMTQRVWPNKPEVVFEGGNILMSASDGMFDSTHSSVTLISASSKGVTSLDAVWATSAATALASNLAARIAMRYPTAWPETVRALVVHAAEWTPPMLERFEAENKTNRLALLRTYGWGVPRTERALSSASNAATLVIQDEFQPFEGTDHKVREFRMHRLPWPSDVLRALGPVDVRLRVTLSYFIEPSVSSRGWRSRYSYASHGLRFELKRPLEPEADFIRRINNKAEYDENGERLPTTADSDKWYLGSKQRDKGSLIADMWHGSAADLADCDQIAVRPIGGWWKYNKRRDRADRVVRYALVLSLDTPDETADLYTPIEVAISAPTPIPIALD